MKRFRTALAASCCIVALAAPAHAEEQTFQQASIDFIKRYFQAWSSPNAVALAYMNQVFPDDVTYFDKDLDHAVLMDTKRRFAERWPERTFQERPDSLRATCDAQHLCTVWGLVDWKCRSEERHAVASGTSEFSFRLQDGMTAVSEDGFVVSRGQAFEGHRPVVTAAASRDPPGQAADSAPAQPGPAQPAPGQPGPEVNPAAAPDLSNHSGPFTNGDIPALRAAYFAESSDRDWVNDWLTAEKRFSGTARSIGAEGMQTLSGVEGQDLHIMQFAAEQGPIACIVPDKTAAIAKGADVRIHGIVSIFIDKTMYLAHCSFG